MKIIFKQFYLEICAWLYLPSYYKKHSSIGPSEEGHNYYLTMPWLEGDKDG
jgi:hypothetical protein